MRKQNEIIGISKLNSNSFEEKVSRACLANPDLPRSFVRNLLLSLAEPRFLSTPFIPRSSKK
jgi:hypothetical protein